MVNHNTGLRELCYIARVNEIKPIEGRDRVEAAVVGGWETMVPKGAFNVGDLGIYFEIDSLVPAVHPFEFLAARHYKIKIQKFKTPSGHFYSQGLMLPVSEFGWTYDKENDRVITDKGVVYAFNDFLTETLGVTYADALDRKRKSSDKGVDKYQKMAQKMGKLFAKQPFKWLMKRQWGKDLLYAIFGKVSKKDNCDWPSHIASKTDVERIQNMIWLLDNKESYVATEKVDGTSFSVMAERGLFGQIKLYICSRNVVFKDMGQKGFYDSNVYYEAFYKYGLKEKIIRMLNNLKLKNIAIQMEIYGDGIQKRDYSLSNEERRIAVFHILTNNSKFPMETVNSLCKKYNLPCVPIIDSDYIFPDTIQELQEYVESAPSQIDGKEKEGIVFYNKNDGNKYVKFVSPEFLMKYH